MRRRTVARLAWAIVGMAWLFIPASLWLVAHDPELAPADWILPTITVLTVIVSTGTGALVASRQPANPAGWILIDVGLIFSLFLFGRGYARWALVVDPGSLPAGAFVGWLQSYLWMLAFFPLPLLLLTFPDGRLPSPRWRPVALVTILGAVCSVLGFALRPGVWHLELSTTRAVAAVSVSNPIGVPSLSALLGVLRVVGGVTVFAGTVASIAALVLRFRRRRGLERQQVKWLAFAATTALFWYLLSMAIEVVTGGPGSSIISDLLFIAVISTIYVGIPGAIGVAVLRYRLYDIDRVINRTLVYAVLTGLLIALYVGGVFSLGALFRSLSGQESNSVAVAGSTLAVAAVFRPARRRIQGFIDRRFYRRRYDAAKTLEAFSSRLRDEVNLDTLSGELVGVVRETMQPAHASLWLRSMPQIPRGSS